MSKKAVTVLTYLHGVKESLASIEAIKEEGFDIEIPDEDAEKILTVQDAINYVENHQDIAKHQA